MKLKLIILLTLLTTSPLIKAENKELYSLTVKVNKLRNSKGVIQFTIYNKVDSIPDENFENYLRQQNAKITAGSSFIIFSNLPKGKYAVNILHDENVNGKIDKGFIMPIEGIGFTNYHSIGPTNRPNFTQASFQLISDMKKTISIIYF